MTHFSVLVIGEDLESILQPYHEYESTGIDDQYVVDVDVTAAVIEHMDKSDATAQEALAYFGYDEDNGRHCSVVDGEKIVSVIRRTNPNAYWDWWQVGGRYSRLLKLADGNAAVTAQKGECDFSDFFVCAVASAEGWIQRGKIGWFGTISDDAKSEDEWMAGVRRLLAQLPDDALLTIVDCHI